MATYQVQINERTSFGKSVLSFLQSIPQVVSIQVPQTKEGEEEIISKKELVKNLESAFGDVKLMMDGKKRKKSVEEFLNKL
jgi:hypothetical protein